MGSSMRIMMLRGFSLFIVESEVQKFERTRIFSYQKMKTLFPLRQVLSSKTYETLKSYQSEVDNTQDIKLAGATIPYNALKAAFLAEFCIFFVFGFFDNFIMMSVGENLDSHLSNLITHSMLAAAFGNWISDLFGLVTGERVEDFMNKHYPGPPLTHAQMLSKRYHNYKHAGRGIGISVGCLVGAIVAYPLLDFDEEEKDKENEKSENMTEEIAKQKTESS